MFTLNNLINTKYVTSLTNKYLENKKITLYLVNIRYVKNYFFMYKNKVYFILNQKN